ncbi:Uncharacterised protein [Zhongshania aliphaticivorans]|uniref:Uncharacterized protein n=1 Tax=Zhongshania aliphaticivorans TaxID=1470434 RepID=A0A5S9P380_9GAMM|nr:Uncharacterised protein [Zhongshania aliphaticivorans]CAA0097785.1 Uncharacterised protein [Zhongshania aliphaticivorans]
MGEGVLYYPQGAEQHNGADNGYVEDMGQHISLLNLAARY